MSDDEFEWDDDKAIANKVAHRVAFEAAREVFRDPFAIDQRDRRVDYGEDRYVITGIVQGRLLYVAYTMRGDRIRIISARGAEAHEKRRYHEDNG